MTTSARLVGRLHALQQHQPRWTHADEPAAGERQRAVEKSTIGVRPELLLCEPLVLGQVLLPRRIDRLAAPDHAVASRADV